MNSLTLINPWWCNRRVQVDHGTIMSKATKRKHVTRAVIEDEVQPTGDQIIVRVSCGRGNNLHEVESCDGDKFLVSMPTKFRKNVWIKRGDYVIVDPIAEGNKVRAEIAHILYPMQIRSLKQQDLWPVEFTESVPPISPPAAAAHMSTQASSSTPLSSRDRERMASGSESDLSTSSCDEDLFQNTNRPPEILMDSTSSEESD